MKLPLKPSNTGIKINIFQYKNYDRKKYNVGCYQSVCRDYCNAAD